LTYRYRYDRLTNQSSVFSMAPLQLEQLYFKILVRSSSPLEFWSRLVGRLQSAIEIKVFSVREDKITWEPRPAATRSPAPTSTRSRISCPPARPPPPWTSSSPRLRWRPPWRHPFPAVARLWGRFWEISFQKKSVSKICTTVLETIEFNNSEVELFGKTHVTVLVV
jgi:hypothetical protein